MNNSLQQKVAERYRAHLSRAVFFMGIFLSTFCFSQEDEVVNLDATITGNQEQPKVLYIVPWKQAKDDAILSEGLESRLSDVFDHVERTEHQREVEYFETLVAEELPSKKDR